MVVWDIMSAYARVKVIVCSLVLYVALLFAKPSYFSSVLQKDSQLLSQGITL